MTEKRSEIAQLGEFGLIEKISREFDLRNKTSIKGIGDDAAVIDAGLDIVLHCNGNLEEGRAVASATPVLAGASLRRAKVAEASIKTPQPFDLERSEREIAAITAELAVA